MSRTVLSHSWRRRPDDHSIISAEYQGKIAIRSSLMARLRALSAAISATRQAPMLKSNGTRAALMIRYWEQSRRPLANVFSRILASRTSAAGTAKPKKPKKEGAAERVRKAHHIISLFLRMFTYGLAKELQECARLAACSMQQDLSSPRHGKPNWSCITLRFSPRQQVLKPYSLALGTALQFETTLGQRDVIGEWEPINEGETTWIILGKRRWMKWSDVVGYFLIDGTLQGEREDRRDC